MIIEEQIEKLVTGFFQASESELFLVETKIRPGNKILVFIDGEQGVLIDDCAHVSKFIESSLDREKEDFELLVSSAGLDQPLKILKQYKKNIGRTLRVVLKEGGVLEGKLLGANEEGIELEISSVPKPVLFSEIKEAKIIILFK